MTAVIITIHVIVCIALILIVLLQTGKGADMGAAFGGGGSNTLFGASGAGTFLSKATTVAAVVFMLTSLSLAYVSSNRTGTSIMKSVESAPAEEKPVSNASDAKQESAPSETAAAASQNTETASAPAETAASAEPAQPQDSGKPSAETSGQVQSGGEKPPADQKQSQ